MCIFVCDPIPPTNKSSIESQAFHSNMFLDADRQPVEGPYRSLMLCIVFVQLFGSSKSAVGEKFSDAIDLCHIIRYIGSQ